MEFSRRGRRGTDPFGGRAERALRVHRQQVLAELRRRLQVLHQHRRVQLVGGDGGGTLDGVTVEPFARQCVLGRFETDGVVLATEPLSPDEQVAVVPWEVVE